MSHRTYVSDIYQWVINDLASRVLHDFIEEGIEESVIQELTEDWKRRLLSMKVCEAPDINRLVQNSCTSSQSNKFESVLYSDFSSSFRAQQLKNSDIRNEKVRIHLGQKFKEYQDNLRLISNSYGNLPSESIQKRRYYCSLYYKCVIDVKNLLSSFHGSIKYAETPGVKLDDSPENISKNFNCNLTKFAFYQFQNNKNLESKNLRKNKEIKDETNVAFKNRDKKNERNTTTKLKESQKQLSETLDCEELSDLSESEDENAENKKYYQGDFNRIDCCYEKVKLRKTNKRVSWHNKLKNGIMLIDGCEFVFDKALADLTWIDE
jgi:hypothetical protein